MDDCSAREGAAARHTSTSGRARGRGRYYKGSMKLMVIEGMKVVKMKVEGIEIFPYRITTKLNRKRKRPSDIVEMLLVWGII